MQNHPANSSNSNEQYQQLKNSENVYMLGSDLVSVNSFNRNGKLRKHANVEKIFTIDFNVKVGNLKEKG